MKTIIIKSMRLTNFKGVRELSLDFNDTITNIYGRNGSGKTTVFDAFTWLLFGKDSQDRKAFDLKTFDEHGKIIPQLPHEVSAVLIVDGEEISLTRRYTEKWVKRAGKVDREFDGNKEERFFNDVPCNMKEYEAHIAEICPENIFKFITSPTYFTSQKAEAQKAMLHTMAGEISDAEVASGNKDFEELLNTITGKSLAEYKREIASKKSHINAELIDLPGRIDEKKRDIAKSEAEDWSALEAELKTKREARADIERQLDDISARQEAQRKQSEAKFQEKQRIQNAIYGRRNEISVQVNADYYDAKNKKAEAELKINALKNKIAVEQSSFVSAQREITECTTKRENLLSRFYALQGKKQKVKEQQLNIDENQFICPTCKRQLDPEDIDAKEAEMRKNFEEQRQNELNEIAEEIKKTQRDGKANNERCDAFQKQCNEAEERIKEYQNKITEIENSDAFKAQPVKSDASKQIEADAQIQKLNKELAELDKEAHTATEDTSELREGRKVLTEAIEALVVKLAKRTDAEDDKKRVVELEAQMQKLNVELADLERREFIIAEFSKARSEAIEARINGLFEYVRFRWLKVAINGAESETCEATINGVPYASLNHAGQIIAGLDIINAICKSQNICAPIFIDNAESINDLIPMQSQIINLIVSRDNKLRVEA